MGSEFRTLRAAALRFLVFAALGPPIGGAILALLVAIRSVSEGGDVTALLFLPFGLSLVAVFSYVVALKPAALAGLIYTLSPRRFRNLAFAFAVGAASVLIVAGFQSGLEAIGWSALGAAALGGVSAFACGWMILGIEGAHWENPEQHEHGACDGQNRE